MLDTLIRLVEEALIIVKFWLFFFSFCGLGILVLFGVSWVLNSLMKVQ